MAVQQFETPHLQIVSGIRRLALVALLALTFAACSDNGREDIPDPDLQERSPLTVLLYMPGRDLAYYYNKNIEAVCEAVDRQVLAGQGRMLICNQPGSHANAVLSEVRYDAAKQGSVREELLSYEDFEAGSAECVRRMLADAAEQAPAERYGLIIGCHGKAWIPAASGSISAYSRRDSASSDLWQSAPDAKPTRSFGDSGHEMDITELAGILASLDFRFDYLIFDDCFMANIETVYDLRSVVDYIVASPCEIMAAGFPYDRALPALFGEGTVEERLIGASREFWNFYENDYDSVSLNEQSGCISLTVTAALDQLADVMRRLNETGPHDCDTNALQTYEGLKRHVFYDLGHYVVSAFDDPALLDEFADRLERAFPSSGRFHTPGFYSRYNAQLNPVFYYTGISVSEPSEQYVEENRQTAWYRDTH